MNWINKVKIKHLLTENEDHASVQESMSEVGEVLKKQICFSTFKPLKKFFAIPQGDEVFGPVDYANKLMNDLYDFADRERIWIE